MSSSGPQLPDDPGSRGGAARTVFVVPPEMLESRAGGEMNLVQLWHVLWQGKWLIAAVTTGAIALSVTYALTATQWYTADVLLGPRMDANTPGLSGSLGGLANLVGVRVGVNDNVQPLAVLQSRDFTRDFIRDFNLLPVLFADRWDAAAGRWISSDPAEQPDVRDGIRYIERNVREDAEDKETKLVTLSIAWKDPQLAAQWANALVDRLNERMRQRALREAQANVDYLREELSKSTLLAMQQSIGQLLDAEMQKLMLARGNKEFAFRVLDRAQVPKQRSRPMRTLIVVLSTFVGGMLGVALVLLRNAVRQARSSGNSFAKGKGSFGS